MIGEPPVEAGGLKETEAPPLPGTAVPMVGAPGGRANLAVTVALKGGMLCVSGFCDEVPPKACHSMNV